MDRERAEEECRALDETVMDLRRALEGERKRAAGMPSVAVVIEDERAGMGTKETPQQ
jgi:hypothetical protein